MYENLFADAHKQLREAVRTELTGKPMAYVQSYVSRMAPPTNSLGRFLYAFSDRSIKYDEATVILARLTE